MQIVQNTNVTAEIYSSVRIWNSHFLHSSQANLEFPCVDSVSPAALITVWKYSYEVRGNWSLYRAFSSGCVCKIKVGLPVTPSRTNAPRGPLVPGGDQCRMRRTDEETSIKRNNFILGGLWALVADYDRGFPLCLGSPVCWLLCVKLLRL
jgi:hypothetical protein